MRKCCGVSIIPWLPPQKKVWTSEFQNHFTKPTPGNQLEKWHPCFYDWLMAQVLPPVWQELSIWAPNRNLSLCFEPLVFISLCLLSQLNSRGPSVSISFTPTTRPPLPPHVLTNKRQITILSYVKCWMWRYIDFGLTYDVCVSRIQ